MPTYDYICQACDHAFEEFQSMTAKHLRKCPECGKLKLKRLIGIGAGVIFKGSGFYETDYRSDKYQKDAKADKPKTESKSDDKKVDTKAESKAESKTDTPKKDQTKSDSKSKPSKKNDP